MRLGPFCDGWSSRVHFKTHQVNCRVNPRNHHIAIRRGNSSFLCAQNISFCDGHSVGHFCLMLIERQTTQKICPSVVFWGCTIEIATQKRWSNTDNRTYSSAKPHRAVYDGLFYIKHEPIKHSHVALLMEVSAERTFNLDAGSCCLWH